MRPPRIKVQWLMVVVLIAAILCWGVPSLISEMRARRGGYQYYAEQAARYANRARNYERSYGHVDEYARLKERADYCARKSREYRRTMTRPWIHAY